MNFAAASSARTASQSKVARAPRALISAEKRVTRLALSPESGAAALLLVSGSVHAWRGLHCWANSHGQGGLFGLGAALFLVCALNLARGDRLIGWLGGALVSLGSGMAYILSSAIGWPQASAHLAVLSALALVAEAGYLWVFARAFVYDDE